MLIYVSSKRGEREKETDDDCQLLIDFNIFFFSCISLSRTSLFSFPLIQNKNIYQSGLDYCGSFLLFSRVTCD